MLFKRITSRPAGPKFTVYVDHQPGGSMEHPFRFIDLIPVKVTNVASVDPNESPKPESRGLTQGGAPGLPKCQ